MRDKDGMLLYMYIKAGEKNYELRITNYEV